MDNSTVERFASQIARLRHPDGVVDIVLDTDTYNEVDDQFALAYMILSPEKLRVVGVNAAPFLNHRSVSPGDGAEKSYQEILKVLRVMRREDLIPLVHRGSGSFLPSETEPVESDAARSLVEVSKSYTPENPLYIAGIGAITNVASALLMDPTMAERIYVIWLGGHGTDFGQSAEFNLMQDVAAGRVLMRSGAPLALIPAMGVTSHLIATEPMLREALCGYNELCDFFYENTHSFCKGWGKYFWFKVIWDIAAIGWFLSEDYVLEHIVHAPIPQYDDHFSDDPEGMFIRKAYYVEENRIFDDLIEKLRNYKPEVDR